jgi:hypothetical protein
VFFTFPTNPKVNLSTNGLVPNPQFMPKKCLRGYAQGFCFVCVCVGQNLIEVACSKYGAWDDKPITILGLFIRPLVMSALQK